MADYQGEGRKMPENVQSFSARQHMLAQSFEIFRYCDARLDAVELHHHDFYEVYLFLSGHVDYSIESRNYRLLPGDLLLINPLELHQPRITQEEQPYERMVLWISRPFLQRFSSPQTSLTRCFDNSVPTHTNLLRLTPGQRERITGLMTRLTEESYSPGYGGDLASVGLLLQLLVAVNRIAMAGPPRHELEDRSSALIAEIIAYVNEHYSDELSLDVLAGRFYVSKYHLSHEFNRLVGTSVYRYIIQKRLLIAKQLLGGGIPATEVCRHCGFGDYANFYRAFKAEYHTSPKEFSARTAPVAPEKKN